MIDLQWERLQDACVIIGCAVSESMAAMREMMDGLAAVFAAVDAKAMGIQTDGEDERDPIAELMHDFEEKKTMYELAVLAEEPADIPPPRKIPRPPKRTGPVNKSNFTANRPPRVARSNCRTIKR